MFLTTNKVCNKKNWSCSLNISMRFFIKFDWQVWFVLVQYYIPLYSVRYLSKLINTIFQNNSSPIFYWAKRPESSIIWRRQFVLSIHYRRKFDCLWQDLTNSMTASVECDNVQRLWCHLIPEEERERETVGNTIIV